MNPAELARQVDGALGRFGDIVRAHRHIPSELSELPAAKLCHHYTNFDGVAGICNDKALVATNPCYNSLHEEFIYYSCMVISTIRECAEFTEMEKSRAEAWARRFLLERFPMNVFIVSFTLVPDTLAGWRTYAPADGYALGFNLQGLKTLIDEKDSFSGRVYYNYYHQGKKILEKIKRVLPLVAHAEVERGSEADLLIERRLYFPLLKLIAFLKSPLLFEEHEFRLVFLSWHSQKDLNRADRGHVPYTKISLAPYLSKTSSRIFDTVLAGPPQANFAERRRTIESLLNANQLTCGDWRQSDVPFQASRLPAIGQAAIRSDASAA